MASPGGSRSTRRLGEAVLPYLPDRLNVIDDFIKANLNVAAVYIVEYPVAHFDGPDGRTIQGCEIFHTATFGVEADEAQAFKAGAERLNAALREAAQSLGWVYVGGIAQAFERRGYCTPPDDRYFRTAVESCQLQGDWDGIMHPNAAGTAAIARQIAAALIANSFPE
jgi:hypothetical protein